MTWVVLLIWIFTAINPSGAMAPAASMSADRSTLIEANKLLEEELKLAVRPQIYLILDLAASALIIKSRGIELKRVRIHTWHKNGDHSVNGPYRLRARPAVNRPKAAPAAELSVPAIELQHMPDHYELLFDPNLTILIRSTDEPLWVQMKNAVHEWGSRVLHLFRTDAKRGEPPTVIMNVMVEQDDARSLAWTMTDGMLLLVGPTALP